VLVVSAFDRLQGSNLVWEEVPTLDWVVRMPLERVNGFDTTAAAGRAIGAAGWYFDSISDERLSELDLSDYGLIIWSAGQESTEDETFSAEQQAIVRDFVAGGGALFVSGSEVLWDLDARGDSSDQAFAAEVLSAGMASDDAGTTIATGSELLSGIILDFGEADGAPYPVNYPDVLDSSAMVIATYEDGSAAAILHDSGALFGFPFECIGSSQAQEEVMALLLPELLPDYDPPELGDTGTTAHDTGRSARDTGSELPPLQDEGDKGCSCSTSSGGAAMASLWVLALGSARRRSGRLGA
jgi:MYXO-CTERM domain-containing protein